jgi:cytochrome c oxidase subunit 3
VPSTPDTQEIQLIIEDAGGGRGRGKPPAGRDGGGDERKPGPSGRASPNRYYTGIAVAIVSILMFFMALVSAYVVRRGSSVDWVSFNFPRVVWVNTAVLIASSITLEVARRRLVIDSAAFRKWWSITTFLGVLFLAGQLVAWRELARQGVYLASNPASSFFYIFTGAHAVHVLGGVAALLFVALRNFDRTKVSPMTAVRVTSYYWHFLDALWIFLAALLYFGR